MAVDNETSMSWNGLSRTLRNDQDYDLILIFVEKKANPTSSWSIPKSKQNWHKTISEWHASKTKRQGRLETRRAGHNPDLEETQTFEVDIPNEESKIRRRWERRSETQQGKHISTPDIASEKASDSLKFPSKTRFGLDLNLSTKRRLWQRVTPLT